MHIRRSDWVNRLIFVKPKTNTENLDRRCNGHKREGESALPGEISKVAAKVATSTAMCGEDF